MKILDQSWSKIGKVKTKTTSKQSYAISISWVRILNAIAH